MPRVGLYTPSFADVRDIGLLPSEHSAGTVEVAWVVRSCKADADFAPSVRCVDQETGDDPRALFGDAEAVAVVFDGFHSLKVVRSLIRSRLPFAMVFLDSPWKWAEREAPWAVGLLKLIIGLSIEVCAPSDDIVCELNHGAVRVHWPCQLLLGSDLGLPDFDGVDEIAWRSLDRLGCMEGESADALRAASRSLGVHERAVLEHVGGQGLLFVLGDHADRLAVKVPHYSMRRPDQHIAMRRCLLKEAQLHQGASERGCAHVSSLVDVHAGGDYMVRTWVDGVCFADAAVQSERDALSLLQTLYTATRALFSHFHEHQGYVIRDYKLRNMVITPAGEAVLVDLGSCRPEALPFSTRRRGRLTRLGSGAYTHWPPEQLIELEGQCDRRMDYFAFGVACFELLVGARPYKNGLSDVESALLQYEREYEEAQLIWANKAAEVHLEPRFTEFVLQCLTPCPEDRPSSLDALDGLEQVHSA